MYEISKAEGRKSIFINYRRDDSGDITGRICDRLEDTFGPESVFMDIKSIPYGDDFPEHLDNELGRCRVILSIVGTKWANEDNEKRLQEESDYVRAEIEYGLNLKHEVDVIPILVSNAEMPSKDQLPDTLKAFSNRMAIKIPLDPYFDAGIAKLIEALSSKGLEPKGPVTVAPSAVLGKTKRLAVIGLIVAVVLGPVGILLGILGTTHLLTRTAALVALFAYCCLPPASIIPSIIAMKRIRKEPERFCGRGYAVAGIVISILVISAQALIATLMYIGITAEATEDLITLNQSPVIRKHIGEIRSIDMLFIQSCTLAENGVVYDVQGYKSNGIVTYWGVESTVSTNVYRGAIELPSGRRFDLSSGNLLQ